MPHISLKGKQMYYAEYGQGFPILFGHSYLWDSTMWEHQVKALSQSYRCIVPELWGHGRSDLPPERPYTVEAIAEDHWELARALNLNRFALVGLSVGGMWGLHLTLAHPEAVAALVLMDTCAGAEPEATRRQYLGQIDMIEQIGLIPPPMLEALIFTFFSPTTIQSNPGLIARFKASLSSLAPERIPGILTIGRGIFSRACVRDRLSEIRLPTLVLVGADDRPRPPHESEEMAQAIAGAKLHVIPQAGHISSLEQPEQVTSLLEAFLTKAISD